MTTKTKTAQKDEDAIHQEFNDLLEKHGKATLVVVQTELGLIPLQQAAALLKPEILTGLLMQPGAVQIRLVERETQ